MRVWPPVPSGVQRLVPHDGEGVTFGSTHVSRPPESIHAHTHTPHDSSQLPTRRHRRIPTHVLNLPRLAQLLPAPVRLLARALAARRRAHVPRGRQARRGRALRAQRRSVHAVFTRADELRGEESRDAGDARRAVRGAAEVRAAAARGVGPAFVQGWVQRFLRDDAPARARAPAYVPLTGRRFGRTDNYDPYLCLSTTTQNCLSCGLLRVHGSPRRSFRGYELS